MTMKALDLSYGAALAVDDPDSFRAWCETRKAEGYLLLIQCLWLGNGTPLGAEEALRIAREAGLWTAGYVALTARAIKHVQMAFANTSPEWGHLRFVAVDVELPGITHDQIGRAIEAVAMIGQRPMIYTRANYWREHQGDTDLFCAYPLWECYFDGDADLHGEAFWGSAFGGWEQPVGKQYIVDVPAAPYEIDGVRCDANVFSREFIAGEEGEEEMPEYPNLPKVVTRAETALRQLWLLTEEVAAAGMTGLAVEMQRKLVDLKRVLGLQEEE